MRNGQQKTASAKVHLSCFQTPRASRGVHTHGGDLKNRSWVDLVGVVFHKSRGRCIRNFAYQVNRVYLQITKRTLGLAEGLRKLVAGALLGYSDNFTKTSLSPSVKKRTTLGL